MTHQSDTDEQLLRELGKRVRDERIRRKITQAQLATSASISPATLSRLENTGDSSLNTLIRVLRSLRRLDVLDEFLTAPEVSPVQALRSGQLAPDTQRLRVGRPRKTTANAGAEPATTFVWGDEQQPGQPTTSGDT